MTGTLEILCAGGFRAAMDLIAPEFEKAHRATLSMTYATPGRTRELLESGFPFDAGVIVAGVLVKAQADGFARNLASFKLAVSPVGMGVPAGSAAPGIADLDAFRRALGAFSSIALSDPQAGTNLGIETLAHADRLGFGEAMRRRVRFIQGPGSVLSAAVARGAADAVITLASEIAPIPGVHYLGRLPPELQTEYAMQAITPDEPQPAASALAAFLRSRQAKDMMRRVGLEPVD